AVDAMPRGGTVTVRTWSAGEDVFMTVGDTGVGMSEAVRRRLFEPFFTTKGEKGNGLGLSVTFGIVQRHGGEINAESTEGAGSTFTIRLPAGHSERRSESQPAADRIPAVRRRSWRVLVVEDEESIRRFLHTALLHLGHQVTLTGTAKEAEE